MNEEKAIKTISTITEQKGTSKAGRPYTRWVVEMTDGKKYGTFDKTIVDKIKAGDCVEVVGEVRNGFFQVQDFIKQDGVVRADTQAVASANAPAFHKVKAMYVSYAKDIFLSLLEERRQNKEMRDAGITEAGLMKIAINLVKQADNDFNFN